MNWLIDQRVNIVTSQTILQNKIKPDGTLARKNSRVGGFSQQWEETDFNETFAPVAPDF